LGNAISENLDKVLTGALANKILILQEAAVKKGYFLKGRQTMWYIIEYYKLAPLEESFVQGSNL